MLSVCNQIKWNQIKLKSTLSLLKCASKSSSSSYSSCCQCPVLLPVHLVAFPGSCHSASLVLIDMQVSVQPSRRRHVNQKCSLERRASMSHTHTPTPRPVHSQPACLLPESRGMPHYVSLCGLLTHAFSSALGAGALPAATTILLLPTSLCPRFPLSLAFPLFFGTFSMVAEAAWLVHQFGNFTVLDDQNSSLIWHQIELINKRRKCSGDSEIIVDGETDRWL